MFGTRGQAGQRVNVQDPTVRVGGSRQGAASTRHTLSGRERKDKDAHYQDRKNKIEAARE